MQTTLLARWGSCRRAFGSWTPNVAGRVGRRMSKVRVLAVDARVELVSRCRSHGSHAVQMWRYKMSFAEVIVGLGAAKSGTQT